MEKILNSLCKTTLSVQRHGFYMSMLNGKAPEKSVYPIYDYLDDELRLLAFNKENLLVAILVEDIRKKINSYRRDIHKRALVPKLESDKDRLWDKKREIERDISNIEHKKEWKGN